MLDPILKPERAPPRLVRLFQALNDQQKFAFMNLLEEILNGICIAHGCPGAGKTHWNLVVAAALQSRDEIMLSGAQSPTPWKNEVVYLLDINRPLKDTANKMARLYGELGLTKKCRIDGSTAPRVAIRMHCWSYEKTTASQNRLQAEWEELNHRMKQHGKAEEQRQSNNTQQTGNSGAEGTGEFKEGPLQQFMSKTDESQRLDAYRFSTAIRKAEHTIRRRINLVRSTNLDYIENSELETVYRDTLLDADIIFTTPVSASKFSSSMFSPTLVIFDEAPHARELSTLIALAYFNPAVWVFSGDLRVSMMARAFRKNPDGPSLNINHRARGNLQRLASTLFYRIKMIPAIDPQQADGIPPSTAHLRSKYIMPIKRNEGHQVSRLLVKLKDPGPAAQVDERSWWHPGHQRWVMDLVLELLEDGEFRQTNGEGEGTILIMAFYKQAFIQYRKAVRELKARHPEFKDRVVEARTVNLPWDTLQWPV
ncbi:hypothetical protein LA080_014700 [Diaporthe eres]|nr:hypothetical protein LA080_014700 [Diaporthe eres]